MQVEIQKIEGKREEARRERDLENERERERR